MSLPAELGSTLSTLEQLTERLGSLADSLVGTPDEGIGMSLMDVERNLRAASRRLERLATEVRERQG